MYKNQGESNIKSILLLSNKYKYKHNGCQAKVDHLDKPNSFLISITVEAIGVTPQRVGEENHDSSKYSNDAECQQKGWNAPISCIVFYILNAKNVT